MLLGVSFVFSVRSARDRDQAALDDRLGIEVAANVTAAEEYFDRARSLILLLADNRALSDVYTGSTRAGDVGSGATEAQLLEAQRAMQVMQDLYIGRINEICFIDRGGAELARITRQVVAEQSDLSPDESGNPFFAPTLALSPGEVFQARPYLSPDTDEWVISNSTAVRLADRTAPAIAHFEMTLESFRALLSVGSDSNVATQIVDARTGNVLSDSRFPQEIGEQLGRPDDDSFASLAGKNIQRGAITSDGRRAIVRRMKTHPGNENDWFIVASAPQAGASWLDAGSLSLLLTALTLFAVGAFTMRTHNNVLRRAARLSMDHAHQRAQTMKDMLVNLGRRNQGLIAQQLKLLDAMESRQTDAEVLEDLFQLDHMSTRMRRNAENLLVLAEERPARSWSAAAPLLDVLRAATAEASDLERVEVATSDGKQLSVLGRYAVDFTHLVAELADNALRFSAPTTQVIMRADTRRGADVLVWIIDEGLGLTGEQLETENARIAHPPEIDGLATDRVGLQVVGRLAHRLGVSVRLQRTPGGGTSACITLPAALLTDSEPDEASTNGQPSGATPTVAPLSVASLECPAVAAAPAAVAQAVTAKPRASSALAVAPAAPISRKAKPATTKSGLPRRSESPDTVQSAAELADSGTFRRLPTSGKDRPTTVAAQDTVASDEAVNSVDRERFSRLGQMQRAVDMVRLGPDLPAESDKAVDEP